MREGLFTAHVAKSPESGLSGPIFSGPDDCADLVQSLQVSDTELFFIRAAEHFDAGGVRRDGTEIERSLVRKYGATSQLPRRGTRQISAGRAGNGTSPRSAPSSGVRTSTTFGVLTMALGKRAPPSCRLARQDNSLCCRRRT